MHYYYTVVGKNKSIVFGFPCMISMQVGPVVSLVGGFVSTLHISDLVIFTGTVGSQTAKLMISLLDQGACEQCHHWTTRGGVHKTNLSMGHSGNTTCHHVTMPTEYAMIFFWILQKRENPSVVTTVHSSCCGISYCCSSSSSPVQSIHQ